MKSRARPRRTKPPDRRDRARRRARSMIERAVGTARGDALDRAGRCVGGEEEACVACTGLAPPPETVGGHAPETADRRRRGASLGRIEGTATVERCLSAGTSTPRGRAPSFFTRRSKPARRAARVLRPARADADARAPAGGDDHVHGAQGRLHHRLCRVRDGRRLVLGEDARRMRRRSSRERRPAPGAAASPRAVPPVLPTSTKTSSTTLAELHGARRARDGPRRLRATGAG